ncbi:UBP-type zinc finger domain-containing protein [Nocardiopsis sp. NPDC050513]|uniref:UBP-type zinc finger domain-containing protein n=1 Tax=Nocardiopsis sp. NPDC050513 TaxID=3364338 RepID=UPI0037AE7A81
MELTDDETTGIDPTVPPSGEGCVECLADGGWWVHLRRCAACGHIGCCDSSPSRHATAHARSAGHPVLTSFEPGEDWFWNLETQKFHRGPALCEPTSRPASQPSPGPAGKVPPDWRSQLH